MNFILAVKAAKEGKRVYRKDKDGKHLLFINARKAVEMTLATKFAPEWILAEDILSEDWMVEG